MFVPFYLQWKGVWFWWLALTSHGSGMACLSQAAFNQKCERSFRLKELDPIGKAGFFTFSPIFYFIVIRYFFPFHSKNWIAQSTFLFYHSISTPFLPPHYNIHFIIASSIFISHQNLSPNHVRMPSPMQRFKKSMLPGHFQSTFQCSRSFSISPYYNRF